MIHKYCPMPLISYIRHYKYIKVEVDCIVPKSQPSTHGAGISRQYSQSQCISLTPVIVLLGMLHTFETRKCHLYYTYNYS